jgi:hypothetical protein
MQQHLQDPQVCWGGMQQKLGLSAAQQASRPPHGMQDSTRKCLPCSMTYQAAEAGLGNAASNAKASQ